DEPGALCAPEGVLEDIKKYGKSVFVAPRGSMNRDIHSGKGYDIATTQHPFTGIHITEKGLDILEQYLAEVRDIIGYDVPLAIDHFGHVSVDDAIRFAKRAEKYNLAWIE